MAVGVGDDVGVGDAVGVEVGVTVGVSVGVGVLVGVGQGVGRSNLTGGQGVFEIEFRQQIRIEIFTAGQLELQARSIVHAHPPAKILERTAEEPTDIFRDIKPRICRREGGLCAQFRSNIAGTQGSGHFPRLAIGGLVPGTPKFRPILQQPVYLCYKTSLILYRRKSRIPSRRC